MKKLISKLIYDEKGITVVEVIILAIILAGAASLVGYAMTAGSRGLAGKTMQVIENADPTK
jgi:Flp pilus assembly pilin Flp